MDICQQDRFLINGVQIVIKLWTNRESFCLMSAETGRKYTIHLKKQLSVVGTSK